MSDWIFLNIHRVRNGALASSPEMGFNGFFCFHVNGQPVKAMASDKMGWQHVSVSMARTPDKVPSYEIMCKVAELFWDDDDWVVQYRPAKSDHVNYHPGCLHWWRPLDAKLPTPPSFMVGPKQQ